MPRVPASFVSWELAVAKKAAVCSQLVEWVAAPKPLFEGSGLELSGDLYPVVPSSG